MDNEHVKLDVASVGFDWRSRNARLSADIGHQEHRLNQTRTNVTLSSGRRTAAPKANSTEAEGRCAGAHQQ